MAQITFQQLQENVRQKAPLPFSNITTTDGFGTPTVEIPNPQPIYIQIDGFKPKDLVTATNRSEDEVYNLLSIDKSKSTNNYKGRQILLNSSRIVLNSYDNYIMLFSKEGFVFSSKGTFNVDTDQEVTLFGNEGVYLGVPNKGQPYNETPKTETIEPQDNSVRDGVQLVDKPITEGSGSIINPIKVNNTTDEPPQADTYQDRVKSELANKQSERDVATPDRDYEPLTLGSKLADWLSDLILVIQTLEINTPAGQGYISAGDSQYNLKKLAARIPEIVSTYGFIDGRSHLPVDDPGPAPAPDPNDNIITQPGVTGLSSGDATSITNSEGLQGPLGTIKQYTLEELQARVSQLGYGPIDTTFSLVGIRSNADAYDKFDDMFILITNGTLKYFKGTTNPGGKVLSGGFTEFDPKGAAVLVPGQYKSHAQGLHQKQYNAGRQTAGDVSVLRDNNLDKIAGNVNTGKITGKYGINIHRADASRVSTNVDTWSAGCQVFADPTNFNEFMGAWTASGKKIVQYTLLLQF